MGCSTTSSGRTAGDAGREDERAVGCGVGTMATATWTAGAAGTLGTGAGDAAEAREAPWAEPATAWDTEGGMDGWEGLAWG